MRKVLVALLSCTALSMACAATPDAPTQPREQSVNGQTGEQTPNPNESTPEESDPEEGGGATCNDPMAVTPDGWTTVDRDGYSFALPPGAVLNTDPAAGGRIWYLLADGRMGGKIGYVIVGDTSQKTLDEEEAYLAVAVPYLRLTRSTHECHETLVGTSPNFSDVFRFVVVGGRVVEFTCATDAAHADVCTQFVGAFHVK